MVEVTILYYILCFLCGLIIAYTLINRTYERKIFLVLDYLLFVKKIEQQEYDMFKEKFSKRTDILSNTINLIKKRREEKKEMVIDEN